LKSLMSFILQSCEFRLFFVIIYIFQNLN
jgi:hypothetical protein